MNGILKGGGCSGIRDTMGSSFAASTFMQIINNYDSFSNNYNFARIKAGLCAVIHSSICCYCWYVAGVSVCQMKFHVIVYHCVTFSL